MKDKKVLKKLREIASKIPAIPTVEKKLFYGQTILDKNSDAKDGEGNPIVSTKYYHVKVPVPKNHYKIMKRAYERGGIQEVNKYILECNNIVLARKEMQEKQIAA